ncbi:HD family phosphohydrolase [Baaleninema simplex]|uniref:HD family phosphohydrolase n=1 Tax=Baaleninema simplex TaxID=2862350 RepID=UPI00034691BE|nr:HD family phosphohydrolase [Baaleninema simplex]
MSACDPDTFNPDRDRLGLVEQLLEIGTALSGSYDLSELLGLILSKSREITWSDAGSVYLVDRSDDCLKLLFKTAQNDSRPNISFREFAMPLTPHSLAGYVALTGETLNLRDAYNPPPEAPYELNRNFDRDIGYQTRSVLAIPMQNRKGDAIGVLQLINRKKQPDVRLNPANVVEMTQPYSQWEERIVRSLASQAGISIERNNLQDEIENLFEGFVRTSVQAIEMRDPCTSGHSERVAQLTVKLAEAVNATDSGPLQSAYFDARQIRELRYAALLHDFGKIGVPEAILVKEKKLYPERLNTIRQRFHFVQRTLELECARQKYRHLLERPNNDEDEPLDALLNACDRQLKDRIAQLEDYWQLVANANEPATISDTPLDRLEELAAYQYTDIDGSLKPLITDEELSQLSLSRGNLTPEERAEIEAHVSHSYEFLKQIPWTKTLSGVPEIAYGHHEKLNGTGYPRGLTGENISLQTQMLTVADIYDALTAGDRPYKHGLGVSTALHILRQEAARYAINPDLLAVFEQHQVYATVRPSTQARRLRTA